MLRPLCGPSSDICITAVSSTEISPSQFRLWLIDRFRAFQGACHAPKQIASWPHATERPQSGGETMPSCCCWRVLDCAEERLLGSRSTMSRTTGTISVPTKGGKQCTLPLPHDVGEAIARYLHKDRPLVSSRRVFLRIPAPATGFSGHRAVSLIVKYALARAGVHFTQQRSTSVSAHFG